MAGKIKIHTPYVKKAIDAILSAMNNYNSVYGDYKIESTFILVSNAWELLAKAVLLSKGEDINKKDSPEQTISCEEAINKLVQKSHIPKEHAEPIQQLISIRNYCVHNILQEPISEPVQFHLLFYSVKFFKDAIEKYFPTHKSKIKRNFLTLSFDQTVRYSDSIKKMLAQKKKIRDGQKELVWLLERGISFIESNTYIHQDEFNKRWLSHGNSQALKVQDYTNSADMVVVVPIQAPKNVTADINLKKAPKNKTLLPVYIRKTDPDIDYPHLTSDIAKKCGKNTSFITMLIGNEKIKIDSQYSIQIRTNRRGGTWKYSNSCLDHIQKFLLANPNYSPFKKK